MGKKGKGGGKGEEPPRRSSRERKKASFGSDFEQESLSSPPAKKSRPDPLPKAPPVPQDPKPGTSRDPDPVPPGPNPASTGTITWPSDEDHWKLPQLPIEHSKRFYLTGSARKYS